MELDRYDRHILEILQQDGRISNQDLADRIGLSPSPCLRRVRALEESGLITGYRALLDSRKLGLSLMALIHISMGRFPRRAVEVSPNRLVQSYRKQFLRRATVRGQRGHSRSGGGTRCSGAGLSCEIKAVGRSRGARALVSRAGCDDLDRSRLS